MKFIDQTEIEVTAGDGGDGMLCFRAARNMPKLGPDGGNGGNGGDVLLQATTNLNTLSSLRYRQSYRAEHGGKGLSNNKTGRCGEPMVIPVPCGTLVYLDDTDALLGELLQEGESLLVAKGGKRGYGNLHFTCPTNRAPYKATKGQKGELRNIRLELKLLADVGLAGFPNAGKSTLLAAMSAARPKIADYPFTTLVPNLGVVEVGDPEGEFASFVMADVPGLVEGASEGKGLGLQFLRHLERTKVIAFVVDAFSLVESSPLETIAHLKSELGRYSPELLAKKNLIILNKVDIASYGPEQEALLEASKLSLRQAGYEYIAVSALTRSGMEELKHRILELIKSTETTESQVDSEVVELFS